MACAKTNTAVRKTTEAAWNKGQLTFSINGVRRDLLETAILRVREVDGKARLAAPLMRDEHLAYKSIIRTKGQRKVATRRDKGIAIAQKEVAIIILQHHNIRCCSCIPLPPETFIIVTTRKVPYETAEARTIPRV